LKVILGTVNGFLVYISNTAYTMHKVHYNGLSRVSNYFYYCSRPEVFVCDAERDLLAIAKFLSKYSVHKFGKRGETVGQTDILRTFCLIC